MIYTILVKIQNCIDLYTNLYVYTAYRQYMSGKLYWRYKKNEKWTWKPAEAIYEENIVLVEPLEEEE